MLSVPGSIYQQLFIGPNGYIRNPIESIIEEPASGFVLHVNMYISPRWHSSKLCAHHINLQEASCMISQY